MDANSCIVILLLAMIKLAFQQSCVDESNDPCLEGNHYTLDQYTRSIAYNNLNEQYVDDISLISRWYRSISGAGGDMPTSRIESGYCQAVAPMWLNGTLPSVEDGIVGRTACTHFATNDLCAYSRDICVKNCVDFNVYYLIRPSAAYVRYCFGTELPCPEGMISANGFTPGCVNASTHPTCIFEESDPCLDETHNIIDDSTRSAAFSNHHQSFYADNELIEGWYKVESEAGGDMPNFPPGLGYCQAGAPIWLPGPLPNISDGIAIRTTCTQSTEECSSEINICVKNCYVYNVYYLYPTSSTLERYCFGTENYTQPTTPSITTNAPAYDCTVEQSDPCHENYHQVLDDLTRSAGYFNRTASIRADNDLSAGWYRCTGSAGTDMPNYPPGIGHCQSAGPIWLNDTLPVISDGIVQKSACVEFGSSCYEQYNICIKNCGHFNVYYLQTPNEEYQRYCFGTETICPSGQTSDTGFTPECMDEYFDGHGTQTSSHKRSIIILACLLAALLVAVVLIAFLFLLKKYKRSKISENNCRQQFTSTNAVICNSNRYQTSSVNPSNSNKEALEATGITPYSDFPSQVPFDTTASAPPDRCTVSPPPAYTPSPHQYIYYNNNNNNCEVMPTSSQGRMTPVESHCVDNSELY